MTFEPKKSSIDRSMGPAVGRRAEGGGGVPTSNSAADYTVLIAEDEAVVAMDLDLLAQESGATTVIVAPTVAEAGIAVRANAIDFAILDISLTDGDIYEVADELRDRGVPMAFHSAHANPDELSSRYPSAHICGKPSSPHILQDLLRLAIHRV
ncbi:hypothetical protein PB2503_06337 [Parvularcula bermudensis HTCC2503]|uniref:Response regulatory domain-containing protein n=1 Tax=Parvularcula bermudensis (strain ATCC BAA-594 / HTCC2503 / KCTC 12087) TaxID=314260 RepID=E0THN7_PARBH|nr:response regulator [Parvularcula bermudensis]ADM09333.1 hypothetical protein PB2503_06337 [Parvularcula bermudensis HTCC2503]